MFAIREAQLEAFKQDSRRRFEDDLMPLLRQLFPRKSGALGDLGLRELIRHGIVRAKEYGFERRGDVGRYVAILLMFGPDFDRKRNSGPIYSVLRDTSFSSTGDRVRALSFAAQSALHTRAIRTKRKPLW